MIRCAIRLGLSAAIFLTANLVGGQEPPPAAGALARDLAERFQPLGPIPLDQARIAGLPAGSKAEVLTWERVYRLALLHASAEPPRFGTLDPARLDEEAGKRGVGGFAQFRDDFLAGRPFADPAADFLDLQARLVEIESLVWNLAYSERWSEVLKELVNGEASGLKLIDIDQAGGTVQAARREYLRAIAAYRDRLDRFKVTLGLAPRAAVTIDQAPLAAFRETFEAIDRWTFDAERNLSVLNTIVGRLPIPAGVTIGGRSILDEVQDDPDRLEDLLGLATRFALGNRHERGEPADAVELRTRRHLRHLIGILDDYLVEARSLVMAVRVLDATFDQIIAPPAGSDQSRSGQWTAGMAGHIRAVATHRAHLVASWTEFEAERLAFDRDLGLLLAADWPAYLGRFVARPRVLEADPAPRVAPPIVTDPEAGVTPPPPPAPFRR